MTRILDNIQATSDYDVRRTRADAVALLDLLSKGVEAENVVSTIDANLEQRYLPGIISTFREQ